MLSLTKVARYTFLFSNINIFEMWTAPNYICLRNKIFVYFPLVFKSLDPHYTTHPENVYIWISFAPSKYPRGTNKTEQARTGLTCSYKTDHRVPQRLREHHVFAYCVLCGACIYTGDVSARAINVKLSMCGKNAKQYNIHTTGCYLTLLSWLVWRVA